VEEVGVDEVVQVFVDGDGFVDDWLETLLFDVEVVVVLP